MEFSKRITRSPQAFDPDRGSEIAQLFAELPKEIVDVLAGAGGSSPYLYGLMHQQNDWLCHILQGSPEDGFEAVQNGIRTIPTSELARGLRQAKAQVALLTALCDLAGVWTLEQVTGALTEFADLAVDCSVRSLVKAEIERGKLPGMGAQDVATAAGMTVLAMGKMGAHELNYSSDIDLICLFDETRFEPDEYGEARAAFIRVTRRMAAMLSDLTGDGYVFRTDLRLRPDPSVTPVCLSMETALQYYESVGRTWERAAHIKARPCAGDVQAGWKYLEQLRPFIWRKHLDFAAIQDAHDMRLRIRRHRKLHGPIVLEGHDMKLGAGGIREIEFFTQTRQIIAGGRDESLRARGTIKALEELVARGWVEKEVANVLTADYGAHREIEHRLQMINDMQTHELPKSDADFTRLAMLSGRDVTEMRTDIARRLERVANVTEGFFAPQVSGPDGVELTPAMADIVDRWQTYPSLRSDRAVEIFERLKPEILERLQVAAKPEEALIQFDSFLAGLPGGVQVFSMFEANPHLVDLIVDIAATAPRLAKYLGRNAQVFDAVIGGDFFAPWPELEGLNSNFQSALTATSSYEGQLDAARLLMKEWHFRIGVHHLRGLINAQAAGKQYAQLAQAVLNSVWPIVLCEFETKHGPAPGRGASVLGMGSLGAGQLSAESDLDLIVIYDPDGAEFSEGRRPLASRSYYARLTQALVTALSAPMAQGRLYEVDMRLRPSGRSGPVATSFEAFKSYQLNEAWTWEHLALTRARPVAGDDTLGQDIEGFRRELIARPYDARAILDDVSEMRGRLAREKPSLGDFDAKQGAGRMQDIGLLAQCAALLAGEPVQNVRRQLDLGSRKGWIAEASILKLQLAYDLLWKLQSAGRLLTGETLKTDDIGQGGVDFLLRETGAKNVKELVEMVQSATQSAADVIETAMGSVPKSN